MPLNCTSTCPFAIIGEPTLLIEAVAAQPASDSNHQSGNIMEIVEAFQRMGLSEEAAEIAAAGRRNPDGKTSSLVEAFQALGLSTEQAEIAARGR